MRTAIIPNLLVRRKAGRGQQPGSAGTVGLQSSPSVLCWVMSAADKHQPCTAPKDVCSRQSTDAGGSLMCLLKCHAKTSCDVAVGRGREETPWRPHKPQDLEISNNFILYIVESP